MGVDHLFDFGWRRLERESIRNSGEACNSILPRQRSRASAKTGNEMRDWAHAVDMGADRARAVRIGRVAG